MKKKYTEDRDHLTEKCKHPGSYPDRRGNPKGWCKLCRELEREVQEILERVEEETDSDGEYYGHRD